MLTMALRLQIWRDRRGRISGLRIAALAFLLTPVMIALYEADVIMHGARPINDLIHRAGFWTLVFILVTLAITPLRHIARFSALVDVRRMIGVGAFLYAAAHISLYVADQKFDLAKVASEISQRVYLIIGFSALLGLAALAITSTDGMVRRLGGRRWQRLHQAVYVIAGLALIHYFQQTKADVSVPTFVAGLFGWLIGYRIVSSLLNTRGELSTAALAGLSIAVAALTFVVEAIGISIAFHVSPVVVWQADFDFDAFEFDTIRPGWLVLAAGLCVTLFDLACAHWRKPLRRTRAAPSRMEAPRSGEPALASAIGRSVASDTA